ncbi:MAG: alpha-E domain-containing protein [Novosphingobium sp.]|nr:alpha-E domain-containing protein [Novosphingobium sp.]
MLGRTANGVFWMLRYLERAENTARLLEAGFRMALTRDVATSEQEWRSVIVTTGQRRAYEARNGTYAGIQVFNWILRDRSNEASVLNMIELARTNARMVRAGLTREVWEATNETWMRLSEALARPVRESTLGSVLDLVRRQSTQVRGAMDGTMLRNEIYNFARLGKFIERADNTARILDVKYYVLLPAVSYVGSSLDNVQWDNVLRSVSAERAYRWLNAGRMDPRSIAEFLILDGRFPRSLAFCYTKVGSNLRSLARDYGNAAPCHAMLDEADERLREGDIDEIFDAGLHEFIGGFIARNQAIAAQIQRDYRFTE